MRDVEEQVGAEGDEIRAAGVGPEPGWHPFRDHMLYPNMYAWYILISSLDVMCTWVLLWHFGGQEVNSVARYVLEEWDLIGIVVYKFTLVVVVILICEVVGRQRYDLGRRVSRLGVIVTCFPVIAALVQMLLYTWR